MQNNNIEQLLKTRDKISLVVKNIVICRVLTDKLNTITWSTEIYKPYAV